MAGNLIELTDATFEAEVLNSDVPVLVDFTATWCKPCQAIAPIVADLANEANGAFKVAKLDIDDAQATARKYRVMSVPTLMVFKKGQVAAQHVGARADKALLRNLINA